MPNLPPPKGFLCWEDYIDCYLLDDDAGHTDMMRKAFSTLRVKAEFFELFETLDPGQSLLFYFNRLKDRLAAIEKEYQ